MFSGILFLLGLLAFIGGPVLFADGSRALHNLHVLSVVFFVLSFLTALIVRSWFMALAALLTGGVIAGITFGWI